MSNALDELLDRARGEGGGGGTVTVDDLLNAATTQRKKTTRSRGSTIRQIPPAKGSGKKGGSLLGNLAGDVGGAIHGTIPAAIELTKALGKDIYQGDSGLLHVTRGGVERGHPLDAETYKNVVEPMLKTWQYEYSPLAHGDVGEFYSRFHEHPLGPILDVLTLVSAGAGRAAALGMTPAGEGRLAAGLTGRYGGRSQVISARASEGAKPVAVRTLPRTGYRAGRMVLTDKALKRLDPGTRILGEYARAARALQRDALPVELHHLADDRYTSYLKANRSLSRDERVAAQLIPRLPIEADFNAWKTMLENVARLEGGAYSKAARSTLKKVSRPGVLAAYKAYGQDSRVGRRITDAVEAGRRLSEAREEILLRTGAVTPDTLIGSPFRHMRAVRGGEWVEPTPARRGDPSRELRFQRSKVERHEKHVERLTKRKGMRGGFSAVTRSRTIDEAWARLAELEKTRNKTLDDMAAAQFGPTDMTEVRRRNRENSRAARQKAGVTRAGKRSGSSAWKSTRRMSVKEERRQMAEQLIDEATKRNPDHPTMKAWREREEEYAALQDALNPMPGDPIDEARLGTVDEFREDAPQLQRQQTILHAEREILDRMERARARQMEPHGFVGGGTPEDLANEILAAGRPMPYYLPDKPMSGKSGAPSSRPAWQTPPSKKADIRQSELTLFNMGMLALDPDVLGPAFLRAAQHDYRLDLHGRVREHASHVAEGHGLPTGYRWVREVRGERIPATETAAGEHFGEGAKAFPDEYEPLTVKDKDADPSTIATDEQGRRLAVPEAFAREMDREGQASAQAMKWLSTKPLQVWRGLVLHSRIPWLENNVLGNAILWSLRFAGINGLRAFVGMIGETRGAKGVRELLGSGVTKNHLTAEDVAELYPTQRHGTFVEQNFPQRKPLTGRVGRQLERGPVVGGYRVSPRNVGAAPFRVLPMIDKATEGAYRRAAIETTLRKSPEVKAFYKKMSPQSRSWRAAMRKASTDPDVQRMVSREVDDALGSYLSLGPRERGIVRQLVPFYAWFREITRITAKLPLDAPLRLNIATKLSQVQDERMQDMLGPLPSYLRGAYPLGREGDNQRVLALQAANPFGTLDQLRRAGQYGLFGGGSGFNQGLGETAGLLNPFLASAITGRDEGYLKALQNELLLKLPQSRVLQAKTSTLYPTRTQSDLIAQYLGWPVKTYSAAQARAYAEREKSGG